GVAQAAFGHRRRRVHGEQGPVDSRQALGGQGPQDPAQEQQAECRGGAGGGQGDRVGEAAPQVQAHAWPSRRDNRRSIHRASASTTKVTTNRTKPSSSSAER